MTAMTLKNADGSSLVAICYKVLIHDLNGMRNVR